MNYMINGRIKLNHFFKAVILTAVLSLPQAIFAQDDGPRMYWVAPVDLNVVQSFAWFSQSNTISASGTIFLPDVVTDGLAAIMSYNRYFGLFGRTSLATVLATFGNATTDVSENITQSTRGVGDLYLGLTVNLFGGTAMPMAQFLQFEQKTVLALLVGSTIPIGNYDNERLLNMGENRWGFRAGLPFVQSLSSWVPGKITTLEITPSAWFFSANNEFLGSQKFEQAPLFLLEAHLTRDFSEVFYLSLDYMLQSGGETTLNDIKQDDAQTANFLGLTMGYQITETLKFDFRYNASLKPRPEKDIDIDLLQFNFTHAW